MFVITKNYVEGIHCWKDAPPHLDYLRNKHRHIFHIVCYWSVSHTDRELEIIETQKMIDNLLKQSYHNEEYQMCDFGNMSCEDICNVLLKKYKCCGLCRVQVLEDGYGGAECQV